MCIHYSTAPELCRKCQKPKELFIWKKKWVFKKGYTEIREIVIGLSKSQQQVLLFE